MRLLTPLGWVLLGLVVFWAAAAVFTFHLLHRSGLC